ncbi:MAG: hypothetical protein J6A53_06870 [Clostridia bacterium]|nr:hypothetical protein [Clostridia bacterium]
MVNFWESSVWGFILLLSVLMISLLVANIIKRKIPFLKNSLVPTSVLAGGLILIISITYTLIVENVGNLSETLPKNIFDLKYFGKYGYATSDDGTKVAIGGLSILEVITYHALALGFIATAFKPDGEKLTKKRSVEVFDTGVTTVSTYLFQGIIGLTITILFPALVGGFKAAGLILPFGFGQGTGQALNYGKMYEAVGFNNGSSFGLTIAALGFLSASIGGVIHLSIINRKNNKKVISGIADEEEELTLDKVQEKGESPMTGSVDKLSIQLGIVLLTYIIAYGIMLGLGLLIPGMKATIYGFNFLIGVLVASLVNHVVKRLRIHKIMNRQYINSFLMKRVAGFFFDLMVVSGIASIKFEALKQYWLSFVILGVLGAVLTYFYLRFVCKKLFPNYVEEQFLMMYGMLTGTASTGLILLREKDNNFETPAAENMVYQNLPAIVFGFPLLFIASDNLAPTHPILAYIIVFAFFIVLNLILFRKQIFKKKNK